MHQQNKYARLVLYIEACESGSMFKGLLPADINIFATTAANDVESSYACYYDDTRATYLGDVYSVNWLEDSDARRSLAGETLSSQFKLVQKETNTSHVQEFGDLTIGALTLSEFQGAKTSAGARNSSSSARPVADAVPSHDVPLLIAAHKMKAARGREDRARLEEVYTEMVRSRQFLADSVRGLAHEIRGRTSFERIWERKQSITDHACYKSLRETFDEECFDLSAHPFALRFLYVLVNVCEELGLEDGDQASAVQTINARISGHCRVHVAGHAFKQIL